MAISSTRTLPAVMKVLRGLLRGKGLRISDIAKALAVSETSVKRWFAGQGLTTDRLEDLCALAGTNLIEVTALVTPPPPDLSLELTLAQEQALTESTLLSFLFVAVLNGVPPEDLSTDFGVPAELIEPQLQRLERLALIDRLPDGRIRCRVDRRVQLRRGPMQRQFERHLKWQFMEMDFTDVDAVFAAGVYKLSPSGFARLEELIARFRQDLQDLAEDDRRHARMSKSWYAVLLAARPFIARRFKAYASAQTDDVGRA